VTIRITYDSKTIDLLLGPEGLRVTYQQERSQNKSAAGKIETINQYGIEAYRLDAYFTEAIYYDLVAWWSWARQGKAWSLAMDTGEMASTTLDGAAAAAQKNVPLTATTGFAADDWCIIKSAGDDEFEIVQIDSVDTGVKIVAEANLKFTYASGDAFRHLEYFPSVISTDDAFDPARSGAYFRHTFNFIEAK